MATSSGSDNFQVGPIQTAQLPALAALAMAAWQTGPGQDLSAEARSMFRASSPFLSFLRLHAPWCWQVDLGGVPVGWLGREAESGLVTDLWVHPDFQRTGAGTALVLALQAHLASQQVSAMEVETTIDNGAALAFYRAHGFSRIWTRRRYDTFARVHIEKVRLRKGLN